MFITLKPRDQRHETAQQVIDRLRKKLANEPGANLFLMAVQDIRVGGRQSNASYQSREPPVKPVTLSTAGSSRMIFIKSCSLPRIAWKEMLWSA